MSTVLVTGGNGFVGRHVVEALLARGDAVRVLALPDEDIRCLDRRAVTVYRGDVRDPVSLVEPLRGADGVLHLAAMQDVWRPIADYRAVNVIGTENVCRAALRAGVRRLVHMSSSSVYGIRPGKPADETSPLAPFPDPYPVSKSEADLAVQRMICSDGLPAVIIRSDQIFGPGDQVHFARTADRLRDGWGIIVGSGRNHLPLVYVSDAVQALLLALDQDRVAGQAFNVSAERPLTQEEFLRAIASEIGGRPPRVRVPYRVLYTAGYAAERIASSRGPGYRPPITRFGVSFLGNDVQFAIAKARRGLGYVPEVPLREAVRTTADWYRSQMAGPSPQARLSPTEGAVA